MVMRKQAESGDAECFMAMASKLTDGMAARDPSEIAPARGADERGRSCDQAGKQGAALSSGAAFSVHLTYWEPDSKKSA